MSSNAESQSRREELMSGGTAPSPPKPSATLRLCVKNFRLILFIALVSPSPIVFAENAYTNHAGNVVSGWPVKLTSTQVALVETALCSQSSPTNSQLATYNSQLTTYNSQLSTTNTYPLSIFPTNEQRRIAADYVLCHPEAGIAVLRVPVAVKRAIAGADKAMERSRKRAEKGLCTKEESDDFCAKSAAALKTYLDKQVESGALTHAERKALGH